MKTLYLSVLFLFLSACAGIPIESITSNYSDASLKEDIGQYLTATDPKVENEIMDRIKSNNVSHSRVKSLLRQSLDERNGPAGTLLDEKILIGAKTYSYAIFVPESKEKSLPMIVILHGMGGSGFNTLPAWVERLQNRFIIVCPSYPMGAWWSPNAEQLVMGLVQKTSSSYPVDMDRVFLAGLSNGAIGAYMIGMFYPDTFAGIVPIAGGITPRYMHFLVNLNNTPVYMIQGEHDPIFPISLSRRVYQILSDMKYPVIYREHKESGNAHGGHFLPEKEVPALREWLFAQKRDPNPKTVRMTREANHMESIYWARFSRGIQLAALHIPGPENERVNIKDGKIGTLFATNLGDNQIEVMGNNIVECELLLNEENVDLDKTVYVSKQSIADQDGKLVTSAKLPAYHQKATRDLSVLLSGFKKRRDPTSLYDAKIKISWEESTRFASLP
jgi:predicted esterase